MVIIDITPSMQNPALELLVSSSFMESQRAFGMSFDSCSWAVMLAVNQSIITIYGQNS